MSKKPYRVFWSKAYYKSGELVVFAESELDAENAVYDAMPNLDAELTEYPSEDVIEVEDMSVEELKEYTGVTMNST